MLFPTLLSPPIPFHYFLSMFNILIFLLLFSTTNFRLHKTEAMRVNRYKWGGGLQTAQTVLKALLFLYVKHFIKYLDIPVHTLINIDESTVDRAGFRVQAPMTKG